MTCQFCGQEPTGGLFDGLHHSSAACAQEEEDD